jgi:pSer/pThr/pTyr-binding forkhead associated (FHA) protein
MDVIERLNRRFGAWYEGLFGASSDRDLRPRDILRRILTAMEDARREGLDGQVYVPNVYTVQIAVEGPDERDYLDTFLGADDLAAAVERAIDQHDYRLKGGLEFLIEEATPESIGGGRVQIRTRFDTTVPLKRASIASAGDRRAASVPASPTRAPAATVDMARPRSAAVTPAEDAEEDEPGTIIGVPAEVLASLVVRGTDGHLREVYPIGPTGARIGRSRKSGNDIVLNDGMVSKLHAILQYDAVTERFSVRDEGSTNGTQLNGAMLVPGERRPLSAGDQLRMGETVLTFRPINEPSRGSSPRGPASSPSIGSAVSPAPLALVSASGAVYSIASDMTVGRAITCDLALNGDGIGSQHARLFRQASSGGEERLYVEDFGTPGSTYVNGERIPVRFAVALYENDELKLGSVALRVVRRHARGGQQ